MRRCANAIFAPFIYKMHYLPRQARDKHRENSKKEAFSCRHRASGRIYRCRTMGRTSGLSGPVRTKRLLLCDAILDLQKLNIY
jgi:hypothetical protein|eukprot:COSAG06_NODE_5316_length_3568_cov_3.561222_1_plen_83_part_00